MKYFSIKLILVFVITIFSLSFAYSQESNQTAKPLVAYISIKDSLWHFIDTKGHEMFKPIQLTDIGGYSEGLFRVQIKINENDRWAFLDEKGNIVLKPECDLLSNFKEGFASIIKFKDMDKKELSYGFINKKGEVVVPIQYDDALTYSDGLAYVMNSNLHGYIDYQGKVVITLNKLIGYDFSDGLAMVNDDSYKIGYIDKAGKVKIKLQFDEAGNFSNGLAFASDKNQKVGYIDNNGKFVIKASFDFGNDFKEERAFVGRIANQQTHWGIIDKSGLNITEYIFDGFRNFNEGKAAVKKAGNWGYVSTNGKFAIQPRYEFAESFYDGLAFVADPQENKIGYINPESKFVVSIPTPKKVFDFRENKLYSLTK